MPIQYKVGNLFDLLPATKNTILICHCVNSVGVMGSGFVVPLKRRWPEVEKAYLKWAADDHDSIRNVPFKLGQTQTLCVQPETDDQGAIFVCNMLAQNLGGRRPLKYGALVECMLAVARHSLLVGMPDQGKIEIHAPAFGAGLAGGNYEFIEAVINEIWGELPHVEVNIYTLNVGEKQALLDKVVPE